MKVWTKALSGRALDWAVAKAEGIEDIIIHHGWVKVPIPHITPRYPERGVGYKQYRASASNRIAGEIMDREKISTTVGHSGVWLAYLGYNLNDEQRDMTAGPDRRTAALRCWVHHKLGIEVDIPDELIEVKR